MADRRETRLQLTKRIAVVVAAVGLVIIAARTMPLESVLTTLRTVADRQGAIGMLGFGAAYAIAALLFVPGAALTLVAGGVFGVGWGIVVVALATTVADMTSFLIARYVARDSVARLASRYPRFGAVDRAITQGGWRVVALLRLSPTIPYSASNYLYGLTGIPFLPYVIASGIFTLPGIAVYVYLGYLGAETIRRTGRTPAEWIFLGVGLAATVAVMAYLTWLVRRALAELETRGRDDA